VLPYAAGPAPRLLATPEWSRADNVQDGAGYASGMLAYRMTLAPGATHTVGIVVPWTGPTVLPSAAGLDAATWLAREAPPVAAAWRDKLERVAIRVPLDGRPIVDTLRTSIAPSLSRGTARSCDRGRDRMRDRGSATAR
jgi:hypothetical protein